jgi:FKBP-type peptidyl-prolyl cis-trans isomerase FkpA
MKTRVLFVVFIISCISFSFGQKKFKTTPTGLKYIIYSSNKGEKPKLGDVIKFNFILKNEKDSLIISSYGGAVPPQTQMQKPSYPGDLTEAFGMMAKGDSALFLVSADSFYAGQPKMPARKGSMLSIAIKMLDVVPFIEFQKQIKAAQEAQAKEEQNMIDAYVKKNAPNAKKTASGLYYLIEREGTGIGPQKGQTIEAHYRGTLLNGKEFDSDHGVPFSFALGQGQVIAGWDEGFALLKKGSKAKLIIPAALAYGTQSPSGDIPPNSPLVFEVELVNIK